MAAADACRVDTSLLALAAMQQNIHHALHGYCKLGQIQYQVRLRPETLIILIILPFLSSFSVSVPAVPRVASGGHRAASQLRRRSHYLEMDFDRSVSLVIPNFQ